MNNNLTNLTSINHTSHHNRIHYTPQHSLHSNNSKHRRVYHTRQYQKRYLITINTQKQHINTKMHKHIKRLPFLNKNYNSEVYENQKQIKLSKFKLNLTPYKQKYYQNSHITNKTISIIDPIPTNNKPKQLSNSKIEFISEYRYQIKQLVNECMDGTFMRARYGGTLISHEQNIYLYGGCLNKVNNQPLSMHVFDINNKLWKRVLQRRQSISATGCQSINAVIDKIYETPMMPICYHTAEVFKSYLLFIGGMSMNVTKNKRLYNQQVNIFHVQKKEWFKLRWNVCVRSHATTIYGNKLIVHGGINQKDQYTSQLHLITLNQTNISQSFYTSIVISSKSPKYTNLPIAFHQIINTYEFDTTIIKSLRISGIIMFGGRYNDGTMDNNVRKLQISNSIDQQSSVKKSKGWEIVYQIKGIKPQPRHYHSMNIMNKKPIVLVIGGKNIKDEVLNDAWVLDLIYCSWVKVVEVQNDSLLSSRGLYGHSVTCVNSQFYIYGGRYNNSQISSVFWTMNFQFKKVQKDHSKSNHRLTKYNSSDINQIKATL